MKNHGYVIEYTTKKFFKLYGNMYYLSFLVESQNKKIAIEKFKNYPDIDYKKVKILRIIRL